jgi:hypothetical protein
MGVAIHGGPEVGRIGGVIGVGRGVTAARQQAGPGQHDRHRLPRSTPSHRRHLANRICHGGPREQYTGPIARRHRSKALADLGNQPRPIPALAEARRRAPRTRIAASFRIVSSWEDRTVSLPDLATALQPARPIGYDTASDAAIAWYWLKNAGDGAHFSKKDVVFECFHNFAAFSQWGNTIFGIMSRLNQDGGDPAVRATFEKTMSGNPDVANGAPYTPLEMFVMELFRTISPNGGSISSIVDTRQANSSDNYGDSVSPFVRFGLPYERSGYIISPHTSTSFDPRHWTNPEQFDPGRYRDVPTSAQVDDARTKQIGFAKCPFDLTTMKVNDGRNAAMANSAFGTVFGVVDGKPLPVCDYAGFAPFGFGYRRCPGEHSPSKSLRTFCARSGTTR